MEQHRTHSFLSKRPQQLCLENTATPPARSPMHVTNPQHTEGCPLTPRSVADTATPQLRQESNYSCFSMGTPAMKATPLRNGRWADDIDEWGLCAAVGATPTLRTPLGAASGTFAKHSSSSNNTSPTADDNAFAARNGTEVFDDSKVNPAIKEELEPVVESEDDVEDSASDAPVGLSMERVESNASIATSAASHVSFMYRHNPYNVTAAMDELHRCDCDQCSSTSTTPRNNVSDHFYSTNTRSPATTTYAYNGCDAFGVSEPTSTVTGASMMAAFDQPNSPAHSEGTTPSAMGYPTCLDAATPPHPSTAYSEQHYTHYNNSPAYAESSWDRSYSEDFSHQDRSNSSMMMYGMHRSHSSNMEHHHHQHPYGAYPSSSSQHRHNSSDATAFVAHQLAMPPQGPLLKAWVPPPPPPRITSRILSDATAHPEAQDNTDAIVSRILQRWYAKVLTVQGQFLTADDHCPAPGNFPHMEAWTAAVGTWWHKHFENSQKKPRPERPATTAVQQQSSPQQAQHNQHHHVSPTSGGGFNSHASAVPQPRSVAARANNNSNNNASRGYQAVPIRQRSY